VENPFAGMPGVVVSILLLVGSGRRSIVAATAAQGHTQGGVLGVKTPLSKIFCKIFITCAKEIKCFRTPFAC